MIKLNHINVKYNKREVLKDCSFEACTGRLTVIGGESGSGKTTLLKVLLHQKEYLGEYTYDGIEVTDIQIKQYYYVPQNPLFIENLSVAQHFELFKYIDNQESYCLKELDIDNLMDLYPKQLSEGERKRVAIALSIYSNKSVIIIDEPTSSLNEEYAYKVCQLLKQYAQEGHIVITTSHDDILINYADDFYYIESNNIVKKKISSNIVSKSQLDNKNQLNITTKHMIKMKKHVLLKNKLSNIIRMVIISIASALIVFQNGAISVHTEILNNISSTEILVYNSSDGNGMDDYSFVGNEYPLDSHILSKLREIKYVKDVYEQFDVEIGNMYKSDLEDHSSRNQLDLIKEMYITVDKVKHNLKIDESDEDNVIVNNAFYASRDIILERTYDSAYDFSSKIEKSLTDEEGIYLSKKLFEILFGEYENYNELALYFPMHIPVYNIDGAAFMQGTNGEFDKGINTFGTKVVWIELPIKGILKENSLYDINYDVGEKTIFVPSSVFEKYRKQEEKNDSFVAYLVINPDNYDPSANRLPIDTYVNELPESYDGELLSTQYYTPYQTNCCIVHVDSLENLNDVLEDIYMLGIDAKNIYIKANSLKQSVLGMQRGMLAVGIVVVMLLLINSYTNNKHKFESEIDMNLFLLNSGLSVSEVKQMKRKYYLVNGILFYLVEFPVSVIVLIISNIILFANTKVSLSFIVVQFILVFIIEVIINIYFEGKWIKNVRNK